MSSEVNNSKDKSTASDAFRAYANSFQTVTVPGLSRIRALCRRLGDPQSSLRFIHVAGTNGKGSVVAFVSSILEIAGYRVGKYTSPNLVRVNERISVNGEEIPDESLNALLSRIEAEAASVAAECGIPATQFEIWTAAAFAYFAEQKCDYVVLEVGLGGELDATNVIEENEVAVITRLDLDHTEYLGSTLASVAAAKAGIMKRKCRTGCAVTVTQAPEAEAVLRQTAAEKKLTLLSVAPESHGSDGLCPRFSLPDCYEGRIFTAGLAGLHQRENAALAVRVAACLGIPAEAVAEGLMRARHPARFELLSHAPLVIYDGAHNPNGVRALTDTLDTCLPGKKKKVVFACMKDKEILPSLRLLAKNETEFFFTEVKHNPRAMTAASLTALAADNGISGTAYPAVADAVHAALSAALRENALVLIAGSLYLYKDLVLARPLLFDALKSR